MHSIGYILQQTVVLLARVLNFLILVRIILSWFARSRGGGAGGITGFIFTLTEPIIGPLRSLMQKSPISGAASVLDFSPIFAIFLVDGVSALLVNLIGLMGV